MQCFFFFKLIHVALPVTLRKKHLIGIYTVDLYFSILMKSQLDIKVGKGQASLC